ncbi:DUF2929 family protein [Filobacillus milosensis]|uniref:DUF2929 family protein n=1 Tax=Filobacillus milosensis TaxID=94137 RepID=A0A4Y8INA6_9BACI|nr:YjzD family protein [Filobacillus milosensis]TFB22027.1 DUF2929 family protein [Filobacillus milosensis]
MRLIWTVIWSFLLSLMVVYVLASMTGDDFSLTLATVLTALFTLAAVILGDGVIKEDSPN